MKSLMLSTLLLGSVALANHTPEHKNASPAKNTAGTATSTAPATAAKPTTAATTLKVTLTKDNMLVMNDYYDGEIVANVVQKAKALDGKLKSTDPIFLVIDSGGGSIDAGIELIENLNNLNHPVHTLTIFSASMGFQTVQGVKGLRLVLANGTLMSHKARGSFSGEFPGQLDSRYGYYLARVFRLDQIAANRTKGKHTLKTYQNLIENEYWCDGADCLKQGFADYVVNARCDTSLNGTHTKLYDRFLYMGHVIEIVDTYSDCALITSPVSWNVYIDGEPLFENSYDKMPEKTSRNRYTSDSLKDTLGLETIENIKKLVTKKLDARQGREKREVRKY